MDKTLLLSIIISTLNVTALALNISLILQNLATWQSWSWLIVCIVSIFFSILLSVLTLFRWATKKRYLLGGLSLLPFVTNILACLFLSDKVTWVNVNGIEEAPFMNSLFVHCKLYDADHDPTYPTLYNKCLLLDSTWSLNLIACFIWFAMILHIFQSPIISPFDDLESSFPNSNSQRRSTFHKFKDSLHSPLSSKTTTLTQTSYTDYKTKQLPPIIDRSSDATLCLPIHSKSYSTSESMDMKENMTDLLQPTEEKLEVPDHLFEQMKKNVKEDDDEEVNDDETTVVVNMEKDQSITTRRLKVTKSCPNIKKNILKMDKKKALDDLVLKY